MAAAGRVKWTNPPATGPQYITSDCARYMVNRAGQTYMAVRLGAPDRGAWKGSVILKVGDKAECVAACERDANETSNTPTD